LEETDLSAKDLKSSLFTGEEELFAFQRAVSRLVEMQGLPWLGQDLKRILSDRSTSSSSSAYSRVAQS
jgi:protein AFG1